MAGYTFDRRVPDALRNPEPTAEKRVRAWGAAKAQGQIVRRSEMVVPPLDVRALQREADPERAQEPKQMEATFTAKTDTPQALFEKIAHAAIGKWISVMSKRGWDLASNVHVRPGVYPARELNTNVPLLDTREFIITASFCCRAPKHVRIELPREWLEPVRIGRN